MPSLEMVQGGPPGFSYPLDGEVTVLGRDPACDIVLADRKVSKRHARVVRKGDGYHIEDLQSTNGTKVGDRDLTAARLLEDGDLIEIGDVRLAFSGGGPTVLATLDASSTEEKEAARVRPEDKLGAVLEIARGLAGALSPEGVLGKVLEALFRVFPLAERGFVLLRGEAAGEVVLAASKARHAEAGPPLFSRTIFHHVIGEGRAVLCEDARADRRFGESESVIASRVRTMLCVPLCDREGQPVGVLQIDTGANRGRFGPDDLDLLAAVAGPVSVAVENARLHEVAVKAADWEREAADARAVQLALIPGYRPNLPGYTFWDSYEPARFVGGDYFDYRPVPGAGLPSGQPPACWAVAVGDVAGKGMPAALLMARLASEVGLLFQADPDPARLVGQLNRGLCAKRIGDRFITFLVVVVDGDGHDLTAVSAGHMAPLVRRSYGRIEEVGRAEAGVPLGLTEGTAYEPVRASLGPGDVVVLYTDGVTDAEDPGGRRFGSERLREAVASASGGPPSVGEAVLGAVRRHTAGHAQGDDMTLVCFGRA